jgi:hypothetical protein
VRRPQRSTQIQAHIPAPVGGLNTVSPGYQMPDLDCPVLYNLVGAENGLRSRFGYKEWCTGVGSSTVATIMPFAGSTTSGSKDKLFATSTGTAKIYDVSASSATPSSVLNFASSAGDAGWGVSHSVVNSAGAHFLMYFDEVNGYHVYTESTDTWAAVAAGGGATQINGVTPGNLVFGTVWKNFVLFVEKDSSRMWFGSSTNALYGTVTSFDFGAKFRHGGNLVGLWSWTTDGGVGLDDYLVAISSGGDVVIYQGTDPNSATTFGIRGVWYVGGVPAGRRIATDFGGDLLILSTIGVVPISKLVSGSEMADTSQYATQKIGNVFSRAATTYASSKGWSLRVHPEDSTIIVTLPAGDDGTPSQLAMSLLTRGWSIYRSLPIIAAEGWSRKFYFGTTDGRVCTNTGYLDNVNLAVTSFSPIDCSLITAFRNMGNARQKQIQMIRPTIISESGSVALATEARYRYNLAEAGSPTAMPTNNSNIWDTAIWDTAIWGGSYITQQTASGGVGMGPDAAIACRFSATSRTVLVGFDVVFTQGEML